MGYTTDFEGQFKTNKPVDKETFNLINGLSKTRRVKREELDSKYGVEGEFYFNKDEFGNFGQNHDKDLGKVIDDNEPPKTQPSLWLQWEMLEDKQTIQWDEGEKFYGYIEWIEYIIKGILEPKGYKLNGEVTWEGEEQGDIGKIIVVDNIVTVKEGRIIYD